MGEQLDVVVAKYQGITGILKVWILLFKLTIRILTFGVGPLCV